MVDAWRRVLYLPRLDELAHHPNLEIRCRALLAAPMSAVRFSMEETVLGALDDPEPRVKLAALTATARMHIHRALRQVEQASQSLDNQVSRLACLVLTSFGKEGNSILQSMVVTGDGRVGAWAAEALGQASAGAASEI
jgi:phage baseplate assembly protein W